MIYEFGHNMGAPHDGNYQGQSPETAACPWEDGYIMSYKVGKPTHFHFSQCSKELIQNVLNSEEAGCLREKSVAAPVMENPNDNSLPGSLITLDETCKKFTQDPAATFYADLTLHPDNQCQVMKCSSRGYIKSSAGRGRPVRSWWSMQNGFVRWR